MNVLFQCAIAAGLASAAVLSANAAPIGATSALKAVAMPDAHVQTVQWRRGGSRGGWRGRNWAPGFVGGAIIGGAIAATRPAYDYGYYDNDAYAYAPGYTYGPNYIYESDGDGAEVAYCQRRFRSYDSASGTYLGYDGLRHPCP
jgi:hypothetical protein